MADTDTQQEPSMEEILASIRRIIAEDGEEGEQPAEEMAESDDQPEAEAVEPEPEPELEPEPEPEPEPESEPEPIVEQGEDDDVLELTEVVEEDAAEQPAAEAEPAPVEEIESEPVAQEPPAVSEPGAGEDHLVSESPALVASSSFQELASVARLPLGEHDKTLEQITKELLRPLLRAWLDQNLPPLVERLVKSEIERLSGGQH